MTRVEEYSSKPMRVCMVVLQDYYSDPRVRRYAEALAEAGAEVDVLCAKCSVPRPTGYSPKIQVHAIPIAHGSSSILSYIWEYSACFLLFMLRMIPLHLKRNFHVIHSHNMPDFLIFSAWLPRLLGARWILDVHDPMPEFFVSKYSKSKSGVFHWLLKIQERLSAKLAHRVLTANQNFQNNLVNRGTPAAKITVINNIADTKIFDRVQHPRQRGTENRFVLLYAGTIAPRYGLEMPIRAMVKLKERVPNILLRIVGPHTPHRDELATLVTQLKLETWVEILPAVPITEVPALMSHADLGIYTATSDPHMAIATPTKVLEYAQMGLPVVAAQLPIVEQIFGKDGVTYVDSNSVDDFVSKVVRLWSDPQHYEEMTRRADKAFVAANSWAKERDKYFTVLNGLELKTKISMDRS
ncbi:MAG: glycosyltransferase family 4 protein [Planctomycetaceae bacterium]|nr:glycosyltransferase family 4 protein [Planctomycetaceae bacterium]